MIRLLVVVGTSVQVLAMQKLKHLLIVTKVIIGTTDPNPKVASMQMLRDAGIEVLTGCEEAACVALNPGFNSRMQNNRPFVRVKMAMSLDGRTALANGVSQWITGRRVRMCSSGVLSPIAY